MSVVRRAVAPSEDAERRSLRGPRLASWLVLAFYLVTAVVLTWRLWADPSVHVQLIGNGGISHDIDLFTWFMRYDATAVAHGHLPSLVTTALNAPEGVNLMWNTSLLLPGVLLAPLTWLAGPLASLLVVLTLGFAGSAASLFWVLRRWGAALPAAALGGAVYGFSPALIDSAVGHYHLVFAVLPPLIIDAVLRIVTGRGHPVRAGAWLGVLVSAQVFIGEELLVDSALAGVVLVVVLALGKPRMVLERIRGTAAGLATAAGVMLVICSYALWVQFHGPLTEHGSPWKTSHFRNHPADFVVPPGGELFHDQHFATALANSPLHLGEYLAYLGWPLLIVLVIAAIVFWRDARVRVCAVTWAVLELFSLGIYPAKIGGFRWPPALLPWRWLQHLPLLGQVQVDRFSILADGAAAAALAFSLDRAWSAMPRASIWLKSVPAVVAVLAVLPLIPTPLQVGNFPAAPAGWHVALTRLHLAPNAPVLVIPGPSEAMGWQAVSGEPGTLIGGYCIAPNPSGKARDCRTGRKPTGRYFLGLWKGTPGIHAPSRAQMKTDLAYWRPAAIVAVTRRSSRLARVLTKLFGQPAVQVGSVLAWRSTRGYVTLAKHASGQPKAGHSKVGHPRGG